MPLNKAQGRRSDNKKKGDLGEALAADFLRRLGYAIIETKYEFRDVGEIDIVARDGDVLVFCEVKTRTNDRYGEPEYAITRRKQRQVRSLAKGYLYEHEIDEQEVRFDVVAIMYEGHCPKIDYFKNAFDFVND
jgi:putative endonuclease